MKTFLVGGAVRDKLLDIEVTERDWLVLGATPEMMLEQGYQSVGQDFPVFLHPETKEEYALARTERKSGPGYKGFSFNTNPDITLEEDLLRRDLTINAMIEDEQGNIVDPYNGLKDLKAKKLRHVSPAFCEDPVRVLRVARFAARYKRFGFSVADETLELMAEIAGSGELDALVPERIWQELHKALKSDHPEVFIEVLRACGALAKIFPEIDKLFGIPQTEKHHPEIDTGVHILLCLQQAVRLTDDPRIRFAVLTHDLGKASTPHLILPSHFGHEKRGKKLVEKFCARLKIPNEYKKLASLVAENHLLAHTAYDLKASTLLKLLKKMSAFQQLEIFQGFIIACEADSRGRTGFEDRHYPQSYFFEQVMHAATAVSSADVDSNIKPGKAFGQALDNLRLTAIKQVQVEHPRPSA